MNGQMDQARWSPLWQRALEMGALDGNDSTRYDPHAHMWACQSWCVALLLLGSPSASMCINDLFLVHDSGKTQALKVWDAYSSPLTADVRVEPVLDVGRTVGIEIHEMDVQGKRVMVWDHRGQLEVRCVMTNVLALCYGS
jgi:hypothetical protein